MIQSCAFDVLTPQREADVSQCSDSWSQLYRVRIPMQPLNRVV